MSSTESSKSAFMEKPSINWTNMVLFTVTPACAITLVPLYGYFYGYDLYEWAVFVALMAFCGLSITAGYHRMWSHKTYKAHPVVRTLFLPLAGPVHCRMIFITGRRTIAAITST